MQWELAVSYLYWSLLCSCHLPSEHSGPTFSKHRGCIRRGQHCISACSFSKTLLVSSSVQTPETRPARVHSFDFGEASTAEKILVFESTFASTFGQRNYPSGMHAASCSYPCFEATLVTCAGLYWRQMLGLQPVHFLVL